MKKTIRKFEIILHIDRLAARYFPPKIRSWFIPPYPYYSNKKQKYVCDGVIWNLNPNQLTQHKILLGDGLDVVRCFKQYALASAGPAITVLDIGTNTGGVALLLARELLGRGTGVVHAFEPQPQIFLRLSEQLELNPGLNPYVVPNNMGLGEKSGELELHVPDRSDGLSSFAREYTDEPKTSVLVPVSTVDDYVNQQKLSVGFIKIDVEGFTIQVLRGAEKMLLEQHPPLYCEMPPSGECADYLQGIGYRLRESSAQDCMWTI